MHHSPTGLRSLPARLTAGIAATALGVGLSFSSVPVAHATDPTFCPDNTQPYVTVADVEAFSAGTAVKGLSVTSGTTPDAFTGTYVGYIADALGKGEDLLLFKLSSAVIDGTDGLKPAGIWAGMSGSPVYTADNKLIGAVSYSLNSDNLPIAGVTPAQYMKSIGSTAVGTAAKVSVTGSNLRVARASAAKTASTLTGATFTPAKTVNVAGKSGTRENAFTNRTLARTPKSVKGSAFLRSRSFQAAAGQSATVSDPLVAGGSIAVLYASGDLTIGAIGTVTAVCGDTVWAFGHPMAHLGTTTLTMANASTAMIVPDGTGADGSYKQVTKIGEPLGMITQDRAVGVRGTTGEVTTFPVDVQVQGPAGAGGSTASYHTDVANQAAAAIATLDLAGEATYEQLDQWGGTAAVTWTIDFTRADHSTGHLTNSQVAADSDYIADAVGTYPANDVYAITSNTAEKVTVTGVTVAITLRSADVLTYAVSGAQVQSGTGAWASLDGSKLKAGGTYSLRPTYVEKTNGYATGTVTGAPVSVKLAAKARKSGSLTTASINSPSEVCDDDDDCDDLSSDSDYASFDDLLDQLQGEISTDAVRGTLKYSLKKGSTTKVFGWTAPGVVTGKVKDPFSIRS